MNIYAITEQSKRPTSTGASIGLHTRWKFFWTFSLYRTSHQYGRLKHTFWVSNVNTVA